MNRISSLRDAAFITACEPCAREHLGELPAPYEPGRYLAPVHRHHIPEYRAAGWTIYPGGIYGDGVPDAVCPHIPEDGGQ